MINEKIQEFENKEINKNTVNIVSKKVKKYADLKESKISYDDIYESVLMLMAVHNMTPKETFDQVCDVVIDSNLEEI